MNSESKLLRRALDGELKDLIERGFDCEVLNAPYSRAFQILVDSYLKTGEVLPKSRLLHLCEGLGPDHIAEKAKYKAVIYWDTIKGEKIEDQLQTTMEDVAKLYNDRAGDPKAILAEVTKRILDLNTRIATIDTAIVSNPVVARALRKEYKDAKEGKMPGVPFPPEFKVLIETIGRLKPGHITTIAARTEVGKTWCALIIASCAAMSGFKVLVASMEMPVGDIVRRIAALATRVNFDRAIKGTLTGENEEAYLKCVKDYEEAKGFWENLRFVDPSEITSVESVEIKASNFNANLVVGDAFYDWPYNPKFKDFEGIRNNLKTVRRLSLITRRHWLLTAQMNRRADKVYTADEFSMGGSDAFNYLSNYVIHLIQRKKDKKNKKVIMKLGKKRDAAYSPPRVHNWDFMKMDYSEAGIYNEDRSVLEGGDI